MKLSEVITATALTVGMGLSFTANCHAVVISITGEMEPTATIGGPIMPGTPLNGSLEWDGGLVDAQIVLSGFCYTADASGLPPGSPGCGSLSAVPILPTGQSSYNGTAPAAGASFEQAGTTFDGSAGLLKLTTFSTTFGVPIFWDLTFNGDGTGNLYADAGFLGDAAGTFTYSAVPVPAAGWLFGSALLGLAGVNRKNKINNNYPLLIGE